MAVESTATAAVDQVAAVDPVELAAVDPVELATKLIWTALQMKRQYRTAGMCVARVYCDAYQLNSDRIEHAIIRVAAMRGGHGTLEEATAAVHQALVTGSNDSEGWA